jgi:hypothetical protein
MDTTLATAFISAILLSGVFLGIRIRHLLPEHHLSTDTRDTVKLATGVIATMSALLLGLLVSSARGSYDTTGNQVIEMAAKVAMLERALSLYGPEATEIRSRIREATEDAVRRMWPKEKGMPVQLESKTRPGDVAYAEIMRLSPQDDMQRNLKDQVSNLAMEIALHRTLLVAQAVPSLSRPLLIMVVVWLTVIFFIFSLLAPPNATAYLTLMVSALSVAGAIFLILELSDPFGGLIRISSKPMLHVLSQFAK